jgi:hypothetical protein
MPGSKGGDHTERRAGSVPIGQDGVWVPSKCVAQTIDLWYVRRDEGRTMDGREFKNKVAVGCSHPLSGVYFR